MKPPREPKRWCWPRLYASFDEDTGELYGMRIVYPNGRGDYVKRGTFAYWWDDPALDYACWVSVIQHEGALGYTPIDAPPNPRAAEASRKAMFKYVRENEGVEPVYLGEIK